MPPPSTPQPTSPQQEYIDALHAIYVERQRLEQAYRDMIIAYLDTGLTPAKIEEFAGVKEETVKRTAAAALHHLPGPATSSITPTQVALLPD